MKCLTVSEYINMKNTADALPRRECTPSTLDKMESMLSVLEYANREPIAIIGIGCRFPGGADNPEAFWQRLRDGVDAIVEVPSDRLDIEASRDTNPDGRGQKYSPSAAFLAAVNPSSSSLSGAPTLDAVSRNW